MQRALIPYIDDAGEWGWNSKSGLKIRLGGLAKTTAGLTSFPPFKYSCYYRYMVLKCFYLFACWVIFMIICRYFFQNTLYSFSNNIILSNSLDRDQDRHSVGPDLGPNCFKRLADDKKVAFNKERC